MDEEKIVLVDDDGKEWEFEIVDVFEVEDARYALLYPVVDEESEDDGGVFLRIAQDENGDDILEDLSDEDFDKVAAAYEAILEAEDEEE
jgi:uncharacterized protein YrzB (UPF0473 family)